MCIGLARDLYGKILKYEMDLCAYIYIYIYATEIVFFKKKTTIPDEVRRKIKWQGRCSMLHLCPYLLLDMYIGTSIHHLFAYSAQQNSISSNNLLIFILISRYKLAACQQSIEFDCSFSVL